MSKYGIPYLGSKAKICEQLVGIFPKADHFYDVFGGGFAVTHAMLLLRPNDFKHLHFNEIRPGVTTLIQDAIAGKYNYSVFSPPWISREEFMRRKDHDAYVKLIWSFGNNGEAYLFGETIEKEKRSLHQAIVFNEFDAFAKEILGLERFRDGYSVYEKRMHLRNRVRVLGSKRLDLQQLERLERLELTSRDYRQVKIEPNSIVYCDPPYAGTADYGNEFDTKAFLDWADALTEPCFISEYDVRDPRFKSVASIAKTQRLSSASRTVKQEKVFANKRGYELWFDTKARRTG